MFLDFTTATGEHVTLRPEQIRALESRPDGSTRVYASIAGVPLSFTATQPYEVIRAELGKAEAEALEQSA